ncbi:DUF1501 domain-containing protein [Paenibacillus sp. SYP-B3998]|uniref:DUF1501 domain-containing protein n=1 Tax=Paenibacillus sp. SYP-B3998 TaxID=2678564 RepID=A0A6G3ZYH5_9BACL|nr:DUF1501 domain-containing protein [Paenibacillus sp. SYP-B3998]NEW07165.1 DUF1501 domain-containing protein [Paenibacillus sp. SYP-B3998]
MKLTRRDFLKHSAKLIASLSFGSTILGSETGRAMLAGEDEFKLAAKSPILVVIQLSGGNDGLNTVIPYGHGEYYDARPTLRYKENEVIPLNNQLGLHPSLTELHQMFKDGKLAIVQGVGYPKPDLSHFRSMDIWQTGEPEKLAKTGWLGRYVSTSLSKQMLPAIQIGGVVSKAFLSPDFDVPVVQNLENFHAYGTKTSAYQQERMTHTLLDIYEKKPNHALLQAVSQKGLLAFENVTAIQNIANRYTSKVTYPETNFARDLQLTAKLIAGRTGTRVYYVQLGGFDDHAQEKQQHVRTLKQLDSGLGAFYQDLKANDTHKDVVMMVFSEFGRRMKENSSGGTDHGTAAPVFIMGDPVKGGLYGEHPSLTKLIQGDLQYEVDFRSIYYTLLDDWLKGDAKSTLGRSFEKLPFV